MNPKPIFNLFSPKGKAPTVVQEKTLLLASCPYFLLPNCTAFCISLVEVLCWTGMG